MSTGASDAAGPPGWPEPDGTVQRIAVRVLRRGEVSRAELARETGMSTGSLTRVTKPLLAAGIVTEGAARPGGSGRPSLPLRVNGARASFVGVNLTADTAYAVRTDLQGTVLDSAELALPDRSPARVVDQLADLVRGWRGGDPPLAAVGVALGGHVRDWRTVTSATYLGWQEVDLGGGLGARTGLPVVVENDVHALTQAAHLFGPGRGVSSLAVVTVGVGVGAGAISHDQLLVGHPGQAGDVGHLPLEGGTSHCLGSDHVGCAVAELSTSALEQEAGRRLGRPVALTELVALARSGDPVAREVVARAARMLGTLAGTVSAVLGPELVLLSGDGIGVALAAPGEVDAGLARVLPGAPRPQVVIDSAFSFHTWAHGAAGTAILHALTGRLPR